MEAGNWQRIENIFTATLQIPPGERETYIAEASGGDAYTISQVQSLLSLRTAVTNSMELPQSIAATPLRTASVCEDVVGQTITHYRIIEKLGAGGMGAVYLAQDVALGRQAAIKLLLPGTNISLRTLLLREAEASAQLQHPSIATFYESGNFGDADFIAMEYVPGETLRKKLKGGNLELQQALSMTAALLEALNHAHTAGLLHRDIKPENIMITPEGGTKLLDFGIAAPFLIKDASSSATSSTPSAGSRKIAGTLGYMSPEQLRGEELDARSDIFAMGAVIYEALAGTPAFQGKTAKDLISAILSKNPIPLASLGIPTAISNVVQCALEKNRDRRFSSATEFLREVQQLCEEPLNSGLLNTLAIVDFLNISGSETDDWFSAGLAETLAATLSRLPGVQVIAREKALQAMRALPQDRMDALAVAQAVCSRWLLTGKYEKKGTDVSITAILTEVASLRTVAMDELTGSMEQIFAMQNSLSASIIKALRLEASASIDIGNRPALNAFEKYSRGLYEFNSLKKGSFQKIDAMYREAIALDPNYALPYAGLSGLCAMQWPFTCNPAFLEAAIAHARMAVELDPSLGTPHMWAGYALFRLGRLEEALREERKAIRKDPSNFESHYFEGLTFWAMGRAGEAIISYQRAINIEPRSLPSYFVLGWQFMEQDRLTDAYWCLNRGVQMESSHAISKGWGLGTMTGETLRRMGDATGGRMQCLKGLEAIEKSDSIVRDMNRPLSLIILGRCALAEGDDAAAAAACHQAVAQLRGRQHSACAGILLTQALAGEARATKDRSLLKAAGRLFQNREGFNFSQNPGVTIGEALVDLGLAAASLGCNAEAMEWLQQAKNATVSPFRLKELESHSAALK